MEKEKNEIYIGGKNCKIEFIRLIGTRPGGGQYVEGKYKVTSEKEIIHLCLKLDEESPNCMDMRKPSSEECKEGFIKNKEDQEKFFKGKGEELVKRALIIAGGIQRIKIPGYKIFSAHATIEIKRYRKKKLNER